MRLCRYRWISFNNFDRKWRSLTVIQRRIISAILFSLSMLLLTYNVVTSDYYLHQMNARVAIRRIERSRCCLDGPASGDICGREDCLWPCPLEPIADDYYRHFNESAGNKEKAFFLETSGALTLNFRQACVVESLAYHNPNLTVHLLMTGEKQPLMDTLALWTLNRHYGRNLHITHVNLGDYVSGSPLERWYHCSQWNRGWFAIAHLSDALRFLTLSKFGGYYFDLDVVQLRPVTSYRNFVVAEDNDKLGSSVIHVEQGHQVIQQAVHQFAQDYKWYVWSHNGPDLITRILQQWCRTYYISWMTPHRCQGFRILPPTSFYPIHYFRWRNYFYKRGARKKDRLHFDDHVIGAHVWNSLSSRYVVHKDSNQYYAQMARQSCPRIMEIAPDQF